LNKKFFISGIEGLHTSIDMDNSYLKNWIGKSGGTIVEKIEEADAIFSVWWNNTPITEKKTYISISNFIKQDDEEKIQKLKNIENKIKPVWICPSKKQQKIILEINKDKKRVRVMPFFVNDIYYKNFEKKENQKNTKEEVLSFFAKNNMLNLSFKKENFTSIEDLKNCLDKKIVIGSFQRDSEGNNLLKAKWQKGPDNIIEWVKKSKFKDEIVFYLIGPRRHFIVNELYKNNIDFIYFGNYSYIQNTVDDIANNTFNESIVFELYKMIDCYLVGSRLEGGPKSLIECRLTNTPVLSTDVGVAHEFVEKEYIKDNISSEDFDIFIETVNNKSYKHVKNFKDLDYNLKIIKDIIYEN